MKKAFTMIELIFIIVIIGILSSIAIPKLAATRDDALVSQRMHIITSASNEIAAYIVSQDRVENSLADMSQIIRSYILSGNASSNVNRDVKIKVGEENDCIGIKVETNGTVEVIKLYYPSNTNDRICESLRSQIKMEDYPMVVRGRHVVF